jgi:hypothetical protein
MSIFTDDQLVLLRKHERALELRILTHVSAAFREGFVTGCPGEVTEDAFNAGPAVTAIEDRIAELRKS